MGQADSGRQAGPGRWRSLTQFLCSSRSQPEEADVPVVLQGTPGYTSQLQLGSGATDNLIGYIAIADDEDEADRALILQSGAATVITSSGVQESRLILSRAPYQVDGVVSMATDGHHVIFPSGSGANAGITILDIDSDGTPFNERYLFDDKANTTPFSVAWIDGYFVIAMEESKLYHLEREETVTFSSIDKGLLHGIKGR